MGVRAGDIRQFTISGREFDPAPEANVTVMLSGFNNENAPTGNAEMHTTQRRKLGGIDGMSISLDNTRQDLEFIQAIADAGTPVAVTLTLADGVTYSGQLGVEGEINPNMGEGTLEIAMRGKKFEQI